MDSGLSWKRAWKRKFSKSFIEKFGLARFIKNRPSSSKIYFNLAVGFFVFLVVSTVVGGIVIAYYARDLPRPDRVVRREGFATKIYDRNGELIYDVFKEEKRTPVSLQVVPEYLIQATTAIEDKDFYSHQGFDIRGWLRIIYYLVRYRRLIGGSTLTQQLVKNTLLTNERTVSRKIREFILALQIESRYSKDEILQMYLNESSYGGTAAGVEEAAEAYFGKTVSELNLVESAILAGLPQRPSYYSPFGSNPKAYIERTKDVLRRMREDGHINEQLEKESVLLLPEMKFKKALGTLKAPHFVMYVKKILEEEFGEQMVEGGGLRVTTTLDLGVQEQAQTTLSDEIAKVESLHITNGAAVVMDPQNGEILAMIGSKDFDDPDYDGQVNVTLSLRQPGSSIKPITYLAALKRGYTLSTLLMDVKTPFPNGDKPDYVPVNYDGTEHGPIQLRTSLGSSINITAVKLLAKVGLRPMMETAFEMGISSLEPTQENLSRFGLALTLGGGEVRLLEMVSAYSSFANTGLKVNPTAILKITDKDGSLLKENYNYPKKRIISEGQAFLISNSLSDNKSRLLTFSENNALVIPNREVAVKTGTTNDKRDNWTIGWTPQVIIGVWVGNNDNTPMKQLASGVSGAAPIWRKLILDYLNKKPLVEFQRPADIVTADVDLISGYRAHDGFPSRVEYFEKGTEPEGTDPVHLKIKVCKSSGKLATPIDIIRNDYDEREFFVFKEEDPVSAEGKNRWQEAIDRWLAVQADSRYRPPTEYCESQNQVEVKILRPENQSQVGNNFQIKIEPVLIGEVNKIEIYIDGELKESLNSPPYERDLNLSDGVHALKVKVTDNQGISGENEIKIGVNVPWDYQAPTITPVASPT